MVGGDNCTACHQTEFEAWLGSHHDLAMQRATAEAVLGNFDDAEITVNGVTSKFFRRGERFFVRTDGAGGDMGDFEIAYTFGVTPLQQYLVPFPDGRMQALGIAWDSRPETKGGQRWFHLYPEEEIDHADELHWTGGQQNWNYMCADCHSTGLQKGYQADENRFDTTWTEIDVACEACHGPGSAHLIWAKSDQALREADADMGLEFLLRDRSGVAWIMDGESGTARRSEPPGNRTELEVCADCHSRRGTLGPGANEDPRFLDQHMPAFLTEPLYYRDGQIRDEVYVWGSFTQSKMHAAGVTCSDCHDPHSLNLRAEGNAVCAQCHLPEKFDVVAHHGHHKGPATPLCADCHMPETTYMVVDSRRDHSIRVPWPKNSMEYDVPNACNQCHEDQDTPWAVEAFGRMFPDAGKPYQDWTRAFDLARSGLPQAEISLSSQINDQAVPDIARATAILELAPYLSPVSGQILQSALKDDSSLVRLAALRTLEVLRPEHRFPFAAHLLRDPALAIRSEAGRVLASTPPEQLGQGDGAALKTAMDEYVATQRYNADRPESWLNLGNLYMATGELRQAEAAYRRSLTLDQNFGPAYLNLADYLRQQGRESESRGVLDQGLSRQPEDASLWHALGLLQVRSRDPQAALESLRKAAGFAPDVARYAYVYGVALNSQGDSEKAVSVLTEAHERHPADMDILRALVSIENDRGNIEQARFWAREVLSINPADQPARQFLQSIGETPELE